MLILVVLMLFRSLFHFWRMNLAVLFAVSVATAVLTGAFLVGDSVRGSLRHLTLDRLGPVDYTLTATGFFRQSLADEIVESEATRTDLPLESMPIISLTEQTSLFKYVATATHPIRPQSSSIIFKKGKAILPS